MQVRRYKRYFLYFGLMLMWLTPALAIATVEQMYFVGSVAPLGSISSPGQTTTGVYLRWDMIEGNLPTDLQELVLKRDGVEIARLNPNGVMSAAGIDALYTGAAQDRRRLEITRWLNREAALAGATLTGSLGARIHTRLLNPNENYWATLASRIDFNVARARMRAYLDTAATAGAHTYDLIAVSTAIPAVLKQVGSVSVDTTVLTPFPAAQNFVQVKTGRCDAPERFKDHGSVALNWAHAGASPNDAFVASLLVAGYDIYRTTANVPSVAVKNIRLLAAGINHDAQGNVVIPGLEKVNDQPLVISGSAANETGKQAWNPPFSQFMETAEQLAAKGLKPGDSRAYYLVPRTFEGNYGETASLLVIVPDLIAPPAPWSVHTVTNSAAALPTDSFSLEWPQVNVRNYHEDHEHGRTYCNLATALADGQLRYVSEGQSCTAHPGLIVDLNPKDFLIYRFYNIQVASDFSDSDGDGFSDKDERVIVSAIPPLTTPGTACDAAAMPPAPPAINYLVATVLASTAVTRPNGRDVIAFKDAVPATNKSNVYWYRIATRDLQGNISQLSKPVRGFFPNRKFPLRSAFLPGLNIGKAGSPICQYSTTVLPAAQGKPFGLDLTQTHDARTLRMSCLDVSGVDIGGQSLPVSAMQNGSFGAQLPSKQCLTFQRLCASSPVAGGSNKLVLAYLDGQGTALSSATQPIPSGFRCPPVVRSELSKRCTTPTAPVATTPGEVVSLLDWPLIHYTGSGCLKLFRNVGGKNYPLKTLCPPFAGPVHLNLAAMGGEKVCISASVQNDSGELTTKYYPPCVMIAPQGPPSPPQPLDFTFQTGTAFGDVSWLPPEQPVTGTIVEWFWKGADHSGAASKFSQFFAHSASTKAGGALLQQVNLTPEQSGVGWEERWCFRARSVGQSLPGHDEGALSDWSVEKCSLRIPAGETQPAFLPWPKIATPEKIGDLAVKYLPADGVPAIQLSDNPIIFTPPVGAVCNTGLPLCSGTKNTCLASTGSTSVSCPDVCPTIISSLAGKLGFVVYRQRSKLDPTTDPAAIPTEFIQASPLIDRAHCDQVNFNVGQGTVHIGIFNDPFIQLLNHDLLDSVWGGIRASFVDRTPFQSAHWYRYQLVYFDANGEITGYRNSLWFKAQ